ncbi:MAG: S8 family serine peptidase [Myxococcales bacterium]|nr:S8 family serine peptidase [Myxococcales bacterium]
MRLSGAMALALVLGAGCGDDGSEPAADAALDAADDASSDAGADAVTDADEDADADASVDAGEDADADVGDAGPLAPAPYPSLPGEDTADAADGLVPVGPFPLTADELDGTFVTTRLTAVLSADATVGDVNTALADAGALIGTARAGLAAVSLVVPPLADRDAARALAAQLEATPAFAVVLPAFSSDPDTAPELGGSKAAPHGVALSHELTRLHAAWNLASQVQGRVPVLVADCYVEQRPHPNIAAQSFRLDALTGPHAGLTGAGQISGNHGFWVSSIIGVDPDAANAFGTSVAPVEDLELISVQMCGMTWLDRMVVLENVAPRTGPYVLNASLGYNDPEELDEDRLARATYALIWRRVLRTIGADNVLVVAAAGNEGLAASRPGAELTSPFGTQALRADVSSIVPATAQARLSAAAAALALGADERAVVGHTVMVGSSNASGDRSAFSSAGEDLRVLGEDIAGVCLTDDVVGPGGEAPRCVGGEMISSGSSAAAPQVSGIAAMLLGASTRETAATVRARLLDAASDGTVDAFAPLVDTLYDDGRDVLGALCDLDDDLLCDEVDAAELLEVWDAQDAVPGDVAFQTWGRADLNGDGYERTDRGAPFDLDGDGDALGVVSIVVDGETSELREDRVTDLDVLCAAAYGDSWTGDVEARDDLLAARCAPAEIDPDVPGTWVGTLRLDEAGTTITSSPCSSGSEGEWSTTVEIAFRCVDVALSAGGACDVVSIDAEASSTTTSQSDPSTRFSVGAGSGRACDRCLTDEFCGVTSALACDGTTSPVCMTCQVERSGGIHNVVALDGAWDGTIGVATPALSIVAGTDGPVLSMTGDLAWPIVGSSVATVTCPSYTGDCDGVRELNPCEPVTTTPRESVGAFRASNIREPLVLAGDARGGLVGTYSDGYDESSGTWSYVVTADISAVR